MDPAPASSCTTHYAFNVQLALQYLAAAGIAPEFTLDGNLKLKNTIFPRLSARMGGYQQIDAGGNQVLLNYRSLPSPQAIAPQVSLSQVLEQKVRPEVVKDRIVLVGITANTGGDIWSTPYGTGTAEKVPGVVIQAQMTSQILSAVLDQRPLIGAWNWLGEAVWILGWSLIGGSIIVWRGFRHRSIDTTVQQIISYAVAGGVIIGLGIVLLTQGTWIPIIPAGIALCLTGVILKLRE